MQRLSIKGILMFQDIPCCRFEIVDDYCSFFEVLCTDYNYLPYGCDPDSFPNYKENLVSFFYDRTTPPERQFISEDLAAAGFKFYDMSEIIMYQNGLAQDPYWIKSDTGPQTRAEAKSAMIRKSQN